MPQLPDKKSGSTINILPEIHPQLIPALSAYAILPSSRAPKRDHDEWLVRGRLGVGRVAALQAESTTVGASSLVEPLSTHGRANAGTSEGASRHA